MDHESHSLIKHREIRFCPLHHDRKQAHSASLLLSDLEGVHRVTPVDPLMMQISYDISRLTLHLIETALDELGYHLDNSLMMKLKRALYNYAEETQRANLGLDGHTAPRDVKVFVQRYGKLRHGCRDERPEHWRSYL
ncbi:MAG TPA: hypothetical protein VGE00_06195 [Gammaproteobacteria bacterium]